MHSKDHLSKKLHSVRPENMIISRPIPLIFLWMLHVISFRGVKSFVVTRPSLEVTPDRYNNMVGSSLISTISYRPKFQCHRKNNVKLLLSLKPIATSLMDSGKAFARSGEFVIELTQSLDLYGGGLSSAGAQIRNAGDCIAQAAASCRFKTGLELVVDEIREAATCLIEASRKLQLASEEATVDDNVQFATVLRKCLFIMLFCWVFLSKKRKTIKRIESRKGWCCVCYHCVYRFWLICMFFSFHLISLL